MEPQAISSDLIRGHIDTIILHTLISGDKFAQQISDFVEEKSESEYKLNQATLYSSLKRLEGLKYVISYWNDTVGGRRKYFKLTDLGKTTVENNLSNWSYSRAIIDKLMDCAPTPIYKTQYIEKIVEVPKEIPVITPPIQQTIPSQSVLEPKIEQEQKTEKPSQIQQENVQEINFRNVLNGLIKSTTTQRTAEELAPLDQVDIIEEKVEVQKFNETISTTDYNAERSNNGKIDFGDLTLKAAKEGYKLRISSKYSYVSKGNLLINKLNLFTTLTVYLGALIVFLILGLTFRNELSLGTFGTITTIIILSIYPLISIISFLKNPQKTISKNVSTDGILTSAIVVFNLLLITFAANLLFSVDFGQTQTILFSLVIPSILFTFITIYYVTRFLISKTKLVYVKK